MKELLNFIGSYSLVDFIPMETSVYLRLFERANEHLWPLPLLSIILGSALIVAVIVQRDRTSTTNSTMSRWYWFVGSALAVAWLVVGYQFFWRLLAELNWAGKIFGSLFIAQSVLLLLLFYWGKSTLPINCRPFEKKLGVTMMIVGLAVYPLLPFFTERSWQSSEIFGIAPGPTCLLTLGALLATHSLRWWILIIPLLWCMISSAMAYAMDLYTGLLLLAAGTLVLLVIVFRKSST